jgi:glycosyltransferase involved in cell wall biosynthesis
MNILHIVDSLDAGGAERVAVNICNALAKEGHQVHLCATRRKGPLLEQVDEAVNIIPFHKKYRLDLSFMRQLSQYAKKKDIQIIHAHSSSFFTACLLKATHRAPIFWHDHYGLSDQLAQRPKHFLRFFSRYFNYIYCVNNNLLTWSRDYLHPANNHIAFLPNFPSLKGIPQESKKPLKTIITCLANFRPQKNHENLLSAYKSLNNTSTELWLIGTLLNSDHGKKIQAIIKDDSFLSENVKILGERNDIESLLTQSHIGVLSSSSEGLPVALLEYGLVGLAVICTDVGECRHVLEHGEPKNRGIIIPSQDPQALAEALNRLITHSNIRNKMGDALQQHIKKHYSQTSIVKVILDDYQQHLN